MDSILIELSKSASVFGLAFFSFWSAIPLGLALGLNPLMVIVLTTASYSSGVGLVVFLGDKVRAWVVRWRKRRSADDTPSKSPNQRLIVIWERYGIIGLGLVAPMTVGAQIGAGFGILMNAPRYRLYIAMTLGALVWSIGLTLAFMAGIIGVQAVVS